MVQVKERLGTPPSYADREYSHPKQFLEDMRLIWANCRRYNREMTDVRKWGEALSDMFEKRWHASGIEPKWAEEDQRQLIEHVVRIQIAQESRLFLLLLLGIKQRQHKVR